MSIFRTKPFTLTGELDNSISSSEKVIMLVEHDERWVVCWEGDRSEVAVQYSSQSWDTSGTKAQCSTERVTEGTHINYAIYCPVVIVIDSLPWFCNITVTVPWEGESITPGKVCSVEFVLLSGSTLIYESGGEAIWKHVSMILQSNGDIQILAVEWKTSNPIDS